MKWTNKGHQFDSYGKIYEARNRILIYGAGELGCFVYESLRFLNCIDGFIDQSKEKQANGYCALPVFPPTVLTDQFDENHIIIIAIGKDRLQWRSQIERKLLLAGYKKGVDFMEYENFVENDFLLHIFSVYAHNKVYLSSTCVIPSTVCNLNCKACLNFTPILNETGRHITKNINQMKTEVDILFSAVDYTPRLQISGGEPLLYPQLVELVTYIGQTYRSRIGSRFEIVLNGSVIPSQEQIDVLHKYDMLAIIDQYTDHVPKCRENHSQILLMLENGQVRIEDNSVPFWFDLDIANTDNSHMTDVELKDYFDACGNPWNYYGDSRIYACNFDRFAITAGIIPDSKDDYFELHGNMTSIEKKQLIEFVLGYNANGYVSLCKRCSGWASINTKKIPVAEQREVTDRNV